MLGIVSKKWGKRKKINFKNMCSIFANNRRNEKKEQVFDK